MPNVMFVSQLDGEVINIADDSTAAGARLDVFTPKSGTVGTLDPGNPPRFAGNQSWELLPDPAGSTHSILKNPASGHCIEIKDSSTSPGAALQVGPVKNSGNENQLWDLLPDPFGSTVSGPGGVDFWSACFIQNPQTGYVIEIEHGASEPGTALVVNPRRMFDSSRQLWAAIWPGGVAPEGLPLLTLSERHAVLGSANNYVLLPPDQTQNLTGITATLEIIEDLVVDAFSVQINGNPPYPPPNYHPKPGQSTYKWDPQFIQFGLVMTDNSLVLFNQIYPPDPPLPGLPRPSVKAQSSSMLEIEHNTIPAGTRIVLTLDTGENDYVKSITGEVFNRSGAQIGTRATCPLIGQATWKGQSPTGPKLKESNLAPLGAFQVVVVGPPSGHAHFKAGLGTITVTAKPSVAADLHWPDPEGEATDETSNIYYGKVQDGQHGHIVQPFGVPSPRITGVSGLFEVTGSGLYPNSKLHAKAHFSVPYAPQIPGEADSVGLTSEADGTFALPVKPKDASIWYSGDAGTFEATVTDADGNWAAGTCKWDADSFFSNVQLPVEDAKSGLRH